MSSGSGGVNTSWLRPQIHPAAPSPSVGEAAQPHRSSVSYLTLLEQRAFRSESNQETFTIKARDFPGAGNIYQHYIIVGVNHGIV